MNVAKGKSQLHELQFLNPNSYLLLCSQTLALDYVSYLIDIVNPRVRALPMITLSKLEQQAVMGKQMDDIVLLVPIRHIFILSFILTIFCYLYN